MNIELPHDLACTLTRYCHMRGITERDYVIQTLRARLAQAGYRPSGVPTGITLASSICELELSLRTTNVLESDGIHTVQALTQRSPDELLGLRNLTELGVREIEVRLHEVGFSLAPPPM